MQITKPEGKTSLIKRIKRVEGQLRGIERMIAENEDCGKIAIQLSACKSAIHQLLGTFAVCAIEEAPNQKNSGEKIKNILKIIS